MLGRPSSPLGDVTGDATGDAAGNGASDGVKEAGTVGRFAARRARRADTGRPVLSARAGAALGVFIVLLAILAIPFKEWVSQRARIAELESQLAWHTDRMDHLQETVDRWKDPAYVEAQARTRLHFVKPGEVGYVLLTDGSTSAAAEPETRPLVQAPSGRPWWSAIWTTVELTDEGSADSAPQAPPEAEPAQSYDQ